jgi:hypothetical protein
MVLTISLISAHAHEVFNQDWLKKGAEQITDALRSYVDEMAIRKPANDMLPVKMLD